MPEALDDVSITDDESLLHRIRPEDAVIGSGTDRPSSSAFRSKSNILSVDIASLTTPEKTLANYPLFRLIDIEVGILRSLGCRVVRDPLPDSPAHALVYGSGPGGRMTKSQAKEIASRCRWVKIEPSR